MKVFLAAFLLFSSQWVSAQGMPNCDFIGHEVELASSVKSKVLEAISAHFTGTGISIETESVNVTVMEPWKDYLIYYHFTIIDGSVKLSNGTELALDTMAAPGSYFGVRMTGKVDADEVLPDGTLVRPRCVTYPMRNETVIVRNPATKVVIREINLTGIPIYDM
jgi:hypothetical protein